jgi:tRNA(adenine34) deaminase
LLVGDNIRSNEEYMLLALEEAKKANVIEEIPVGAIIVKDGKIISKAHNIKENKNDATKHAEIIAIQKASKKLNSWRLNDCLLFVTLEPCIMCIGAAIEARVGTIICGTQNEKYDAIVKQIAKENKIEIKMGILKEECEKIIKVFFENQRKK